MEIIVSKLLPMISRLGGFHTLVSFLGSIGKLMGGSDLNAVYKIIYVKNTVDHRITGKANIKSNKGSFSCSCRSAHHTNNAFVS